MTDVTLTIRRLGALDGRSLLKTRRLFRHEPEISPKGECRQRTSCRCCPAPYPTAIFSFL